MSALFFDAGDGVAGRAATPLVVLRPEVEHGAVNDNASEAPAVCIDLFPVGTRVDDPSTLADPRPPLMKRMCMCCELVLGWVVCSAEQANQVSHGLCLPCYDKEKEKHEQTTCNRPSPRLL